MPAPSRAGYRRHGTHRHLIRAPFGGRAVQYWRSLGPGLVTGASDNDPSGIGTYSVAGASTGYRLLWMAPFTMPLLVAVQSMAARIGACNEQGLGKAIENRFGRKVLVTSVAILVVANVVTIAADLGGVAAGVHELAPIPVGIVIPIVAAGLLAVEIFWSYRRFASLVKWLTLVLFLYIVSGFVAGPDWGSVLKGTFIPQLSFSSEFLSSAVAILVLAGSAAYPLAELFGWREGLNHPLRKAPGFYAALSAAVALGVALNFLGVNPVRALVYAAVLQGFLAPILLVLLTLIARDRNVMGPHRNGWFDTTFGFLAAGVMAAAAVALIVVTFVG